MTGIATTPDAPPIQPAALAAVRREWRRSRHSSSERWDSHRLSEQLPRVALHEALEILLDWRGEPRFDAGAVAWHARLAGQAPRLTLDDAERALIALEGLGGSCPAVGAMALRALCERHSLAETAAVLDDWLAQRQSYGGF